MSETMREPLSWLLLERYALDELTPAKRAQVEANLAESAQDRACLDSILRDAAELPPLPAPLAARPSRRPTWLYVSSALAVAAAIALLVRPEAPPASQRLVHDGVKGGEVALVLASAQTGEDAEAFDQGERFKLLVTCPSWLSTQLHVVVFQAGERYEPLAQGPTFACGNLVPWPGAFALDGAMPADVCISFGDPHQLASARSARELSPSVVCKRLSPR